MESLKVSDLPTQKIRIDIFPARHANEEPRFRWVLAYDSRQLPALPKGREYWAKTPIYPAPRLSSYLSAYMDGWNYGCIRKLENMQARKSLKRKNAT